MNEILESEVTAAEVVLHRRLAAVMCIHGRDSENGYCVVCGEIEGWPCRTRAVANGLVWNRPARGGVTC